jgi:prevent-host-death family protein
MTMSNGKNRWSVAEAKSRLSELIEHAGRRPQVIERRGEPVAVVVGKQDFELLGDSTTGTLRAARLASFLELSSQISRAGGAELRIAPRTRRPSPFARRR